MHSYSEGTVFSFPRVRWKRHETNHFLPSSAENVSVGAKPQKNPIRTSYLTTGMHPLEFLDSHNFLNFPMNFNVTNIVV